MVSGKTARATAMVGLDMGSVNAGVGWVQVTGMGSGNPGNKCVR